MMGKRHTMIAMELWTIMVHEDFEVVGFSRVLMWILEIFSLHFLDEDSDEAVLGREQI